MNSSRLVALDLLKIISMLMVVVLHITNNTMGLTGVVFNNIFDIESLFCLLLRAFSLVAVNCFVLITGYFMCQATASYKKVIRLWFTIFTYSFGIYSLLCIAPFTSIRFTAGEFIANLFPVVHRQYWFVTAYFLLYILSPYINKMIAALTQKQHKALLLLLFILFSVFPTVFGDNIGTNGGYSLCWFIVLYITAAYIRLYPLPELHYGILYTVISVFTFGMLLLNSNFSDSENYFAQIPSHFSGYNSVNVYLAAVALFLFFRGLNWSPKPAVSHFISKISALSFGVYLLHEHAYLRPIIWNKIVCLERFRNSPPKFILVMILSVFAVFIAGILLEWCRSFVYKFIEPYIVKVTDNITHPHNK